MTRFADLCRLAELEIERGLTNTADQAVKVKALPKWTPHQGPQKQFFESDVDEILYGGSAGGGKSAAAVALPMPWIDQRDLRVLILRRESGQLKDLVDEARRVYKLGESKGAKPYAPAEPDVQFVSSPTHEARFPLGARIEFGHCQAPDDWEIYQGRAFQIIVFDELTHFLEKQYLEIISRCRSAIPGLPRKIRATSNPGSRGHEWVFKRWRWWLDPEATIPGRHPRWRLPDGSALAAPADDPRLDGATKLPPAAPGEVLLIKKDLATEEEVVIFEQEYEEQVVDGETIRMPLGMTRTFIPARLEDNPTLVKNDPSYRLKIRQSGAVRRRQLEDGDWLVKPAAGLFFQRAWFPIVPAAPSDVLARVRYWDRGGTKTGDWTIGVRISYTRFGVWYVEHVARMRGDAAEVEAFIRGIAAADMSPEFTTLILEQDPAQAGLKERHYLSNALAEFAPRWVAPLGNKEFRADPASAQAKIGNIRIVGTPDGAGGARPPAWYEPFMGVLEGFPDGDYDDDVDGLSGGFNESLRIARLAKPARGRVRVIGEQP